MLKKPVDALLSLAKSSFYRVLNRTDIYDVFGYVDREGHGHFVYQSVIPNLYNTLGEAFIADQKFLPIFGHNQVVSIKNGFKEEYVIHDNQGRIPIDKLIETQLAGKGNYVYYIDSEDNVIKVSEKSKFEKLNKI